MQKKHQAKTIRLTEQDKEALAALREYYGLSSDNEAIRFALNLAWRSLGQQAPNPSRPKR